MGRRIGDADRHDQMRQRRFQICRRLGRQSDAGGCACSQRATGIAALAFFAAVVAGVIAWRCDGRGERQRCIGH
ncbi:hypothetical protein, partial [Vineibacter terrae]|uniref:hypothetical protein n=1 Tax=Vineibacter terrae TaxID=2586908 RepID=UPI002E33D812